MSKYTRGPWQYFQNKNKTGFYVGSDETQNTPCGRIADICQFSHEKYGPIKQQAEANAQLIAAAPELLDALEGLVKNPNSGLHHNIAQSAIAKATGG